MNLKIKIWVTFSFYLFPTGWALAQEIGVTATTWQVTVSALDVTVAGEPPVVQIQSATNHAAVDIKGKKVFDWIVQIERTAGSWHANLELSARVTDPGNGPGTLTTYGDILIGSSPTTFFSGGKNRSNIYVQYELNAPTPPPAGTYSTTVTYTVLAN